MTVEVGSFGAFQLGFSGVFERLAAQTIDHPQDDAGVCPTVQLDEELLKIIHCVLGKETRGRSHSSCHPLSCGSRGKPGRGFVPAGVQLAGPRGGKDAVCIHEPPICPTGLKTRFRLPQAISLITGRSGSMARI